MQQQKKELGLLVLILVVGAITAALNPRFLSPVNLVNMANLIGLFGLFSIGVGLVIITGGIDVGAKGEIYTLLRQLADNGVAILMISSDMEEVIGVSDRIAVMHEGTISGFLDRPRFSEHNVLQLAVGHTAAAA